MTVYLDHNATAPVRPEARDAVMAALEAVGNPSSVHGPGRSARARIETARGVIAKKICARAEDLVFTSGGMEANNLGLRAGIAAGATRVIVSAIEHDAVGAGCAADLHANARGQRPRGLPRTAQIEHDELVSVAERAIHGHGQPLPPTGD